MDDNNNHKNTGNADAYNAAKRQKVETEQRSAFEQDMARIQAATAMQNHPGNGASQPHMVVVASTAASSAGAGVGIAPGTSAASATNAHIDRPRVDHSNVMDDGNEGEEGNWLKNFKSGQHTRIGNNFQVTELPSSSHRVENNNANDISPAAAHVVLPESDSNNRHNNPRRMRMESEDDDEDEEEGNWLKNFTPHHTRVGADYQVAQLPTPSTAK